MVIIIMAHQKNKLMTLLVKSTLLLLELDVKGANIQKKYPNNTLSFFVEPPSISELKC